MSADTDPTQESIAESPPATPPEAAADYSWGVTAANWFLITVGVAIQSNWLMAGTFTSLLGGLLAVIVLAAIPVCIVYLSARNKKAFRWRRAMTIAGWCTLAIMLYPMLSDFMKTN